MLARPIWADDSCGAYYGEFDLSMPYFSPDGRLWLCEDGRVQLCRVEYPCAYNRINQCPRCGVDTPCSFFQWVRGVAVESPICINFGYESHRFEVLDFPLGPLDLYLQGGSCWVLFQTTEANCVYRTRSPIGHVRRTVYRNSDCSGQPVTSIVFDVYAWIRLEATYIEVFIGVQNYIALFYARTEAPLPCREGSVSNQIPAVGYWVAMGMVAMATGGQCRWKCAPWCWYTSPSTPAVCCHDGFVAPQRLRLTVSGVVLPTECLPLEFAGGYVRYELLQGSLNGSWAMSYRGGFNYPHMGRCWFETDQTAEVLVYRWKRGHSCNDPPDSWVRLQVTFSLWLSWIRNLNVCRYYQPPGEPPSPQEPVEFAYGEAVLKCNNLRLLGMQVCRDRERCFCETPPLWWRCGACRGAGDDYFNACDILRQQWDNGWRCDEGPRCSPVMAFHFNCTHCGDHSLGDLLLMPGAHATVEYW